MPGELLFVYGTLHPDRAPAEIAADVRRFVFVGEGTMQGELLQLSGYPGLRMGTGMDRLVRGVIFALPDDEALLARLDAYEDYRPGDLDGSLFIRRQLRVAMDDGQSLLCWVYLYNR